MTRTKRALSLWPMICLASTLPGLAAAADHINLEEGLPVELADTIPVSYRNTEVQGLARWTHTKDGEEECRLEPRLEYGLWYNTQVSIGSPFEFGEAVEDDEFKDVDLELFYNFNQETRLVPAFALAATAVLPTSDDGEGVDSRLKLLLSKTVGWSTLFQRVHLNAAWHHNSDALVDERDDYYKVVVGYDRLINAQTQLIVDYVWEEKREESDKANIIEVGLRYQYTPLTVLATGIGAGVGSDSPDLRLSLAFQHSFNGWY